jgi:ribonuclease-3
VKLSRDLSEFSDRLGYRFSKPDLLVRAVTHSSISSSARPDNQRFEFLGDRVLGLVIAETVLAQDPHAKEGKLAPRFNALVRKETCADIARAVDLGAVLKIGRSEMATGGRRKTALLGDAMEAVIAAIYLDGGLAAAQSVILHLWATHIASLADDARDAKTALQEHAQAHGHPPPVYRELARKGPDHAPIFKVEVALKTGQSAQAEASSKKQAEQAAARVLLQGLTKEK